MEEKKYPIFEDDGSNVVSEPAVATPLIETPLSSMTTADEDNLDWSRFPSYGPFSEEEAIARIEKAEAEMNDPSKWISSEQMWKRIHDKYPWLR